MTVIFLILPITLLLSIGAVLAFSWATRSGQFDDLDTPALRALHDSSEPPASKSPHELSVSAQSAEPPVGRHGTARGSQSTMLNRTACKS